MRKIREREENRQKQENIRKEQNSKRLEVQRKAENLVDTGFCIRCGRIIPLDKDNPMCMKCFNVWNSFQNYNFQEQFCHICNSKSDYISMSNSSCKLH